MRVTVFWVETFSGGPSSFRRVFRTEQAARRAALRASATGSSALVYAAVWDPEFDIWGEASLIARHGRPPEPRRAAERAAA